MGFKPKTNFTRGRNYIVGEGTERVAFNNMVKASKEKERQKFEGETNNRKNLNGSIADKITQGWPEEEIQIAIEKEFPNEGSTRIRNLIKHWKEQYQKLIQEIEKLIDKVRNGEITKAKADNLMTSRYEHYSIFKSFARSYYTQKKEELGDEER